MRQNAPGWAKMHQDALFVLRQRVVVAWADDDANVAVPLDAADECAGADGTDVMQAPLCDQAAVDCEANGWAKQWLHGYPPPARALTSFHPPSWQRGGAGDVPLRALCWQGPARRCFLHQQCALCGATTI